MLKTPIAYYGGKQNMLEHILPLIPQHTIYTEAYFGGGAVFFAKQPSQSETINDLNHMVINFYEIVRTNFDALKEKIEASLFSRVTYTIAWTIYRMPQLFSKLERAWAFYIATNMGFACTIGSWGFDKYGKRSKAFLNKKLKFNGEIAKRLELVKIECNDACFVIQSDDANDAFHYIDPPYIESHQGHYGGYTEEDYIRLLETLTTIKGKFLLSSYPSEILEKYIKQNGWYTKSFDKPLSAQKSVDGKSKKRKTELLTANYPI
jgi:DNA adenine methylase